MKYAEKLKISKAEAGRLNKALNWKKGWPESERFGADDIFARTVRFKNGFQADLKVVGTDYEDWEEEDEELLPYHNAAWSEMVLFTPQGSEAAVSEVCDNYVGKWILRKGRDTYEVTIEVE